MNSKNIIHSSLYTSGRVFLIRFYNLAARCQNETLDNVKWVCEDFCIRCTWHLDMSQILHRRIGSIWQEICIIGLSIYQCFSTTRWQEHWLKSFISILKSWFQIELHAKTTSMYILRQIKAEKSNYLQRTPENSEILRLCWLSSGPKFPKSTFQKYHSCRQRANGWT